MFKNYIILCQYIKIRPDLPRERVLQREYSERTTNRDWLAVCHAHVDSTYVRTYDWMTKGGEEVRSAGKATGPFESSELTEASLVRHGSRSCSWLRARMCVCIYVCEPWRACAPLERGNWCARPSSLSPPFDLLPSCASLCLSVTSRHFSRPFALPTYTCNACVCARVRVRVRAVHTRSFVDRLFTGFRV